MRLERSHGDRFKNTYLQATIAMATLIFYPSTSRAAAYE